MNLKKFGITVGLVGLLLIACNLLLIFIGIPLSNKDAPPIGIIGGADGPTAQFLTNKILMDTWPGVLLTIGLALIPVAAVCLIYWMTAKKGK